MNKVLLSGIIDRVDFHGIYENKPGFYLITEEDSSRIKLYLSTSFICQNYSMLSRLKTGSKVTVRGSVLCTNYIDSLGKKIDILKILVNGIGSDNP